MLNIILVMFIYSLIVSMAFAESGPTCNYVPSNILPDIIKGLILLMFGSLLAIFSEPIRQIFLGKFLRPKLEISFDGDDPDFRTETPEVNREKIFDKVDGGFKEKIIEKERYKAIYVRIKVKNTKYYIAKSCRAFLVNGEKKDGDRFIRADYADSIQLEWSTRGEQGFNEIDLPFDIPYFVVIISTREIEPNKIKLHIQPSPYRYEHLFNEIGTYRFTIQVSGDNIRPEIFKLNLEWFNKWNNFKVYPN